MPLKIHQRVLVFRYKTKRGPRLINRDTVVFIEASRLFSEHLEVCDEIVSKVFQLKRYD